VLAAALIALHSGSYADLTGTLTIVDRTEVRTRNYQGETEPAFDAVNTPGARLDLVGRTVAFSLGYFPSFTLADLELGLHPQLFQTISSAVSWRATRRLRLSLGEDGSYGLQNYAYLNPPTEPTAVSGAPVAAPAALQLLPGAQTIRYGSSRSWASMEVRASRDLQLTLSPSCFIGGGLDSASREAIPLQTTPRVQLDVMAILDRRDTITTTFAAVDSTFTAFPCDPSTGGPPTAASLALTPNATCAPHDDLVEASETWRRRLTRSDEIALAAGVSAARGRFDLAGERTVVLPTGAATVLHRFAEHGELTAELRVAPVIDVRYGIIDERGQARVACKWTLARLVFAVSGGFTQSLPASEVNAVTFAGADAESRYAIGSDKRFEVGAGLRGAWQQQQPYSPFFSDVVYAVFVYHEPALRLWP
jgi:hypothetical protein